MKITDEDRERMARILMFRPNCPQDWDRSLIDKMIVGERERGCLWLYREISARYKSPHMEQIIRVAKIFAKNAAACGDIECVPCCDTCKCVKNARTAIEAMQS